MKKLVKCTPIALLLLLAGLLFSTNTLKAQTIVLDYMYVKQANTGLYLEVEQEWKNIHNKRMEAGLINGWQLWRKRHATDGDPYQFITIQWYKDWEHSFKEAPEGFWEGLGLGEDLFEKTLKSRKHVKSEVMHEVAKAENNMGGDLIKVNYMKVHDNKLWESVELERKVFKTLFEEEIRQERRNHWGVWTSYPYSAGQYTLITVDGYKDASQMFSEGEDLFKKVHPDLDPDEIMLELQKLRTIDAVEIWELVDAVWGEE